MSIVSKARAGGVPAVLCAVLLASAVPMAAAGPKEDAEQAEKEFARGSLIVAMELWRNAANAGHALAQARLGDMLDKAEEDEEAVRWYRKSAEQGEPAGEFGLGEMYAKGEGVKQDIEQARKHISSAAEKGYLPAMVAVRDMYKKGGLGLAPDLARSAEWDERIKPLLPAEVAAAPPPPAPTTRRRRP